jgi:micrococcal nuclease
MDNGKKKKCKVISMKKLQYRKIILISLVLPLIAALIACSGNASHSQTDKQPEAITGKVIGIIDGDTYDLLTPEKKTVRIRTAAIDAPERGMPFYKVSKQYLAKLCFGKTVTLKEDAIDRYGRIVAFTYLPDSREVSAEMLKAGMAWHFKKYNTDKDLAQLEIEARNARKGLWVDKDPMEPWRNRKLHRSGISTKDSFDIQPGQH